MKTASAEELTKPLLSLIAPGITTREEIDDLVAKQLQRQAGFPITHRPQSRYDSLRGMVNLQRSISSRLTRDDQVLPG